MASSFVQLDFVGAWERDERGVDAQKDKKKAELHLVAALGFLGNPRNPLFQVIA
jgi:hypothetical protein